MKETLLRRTVTTGYYYLSDYQAFFDSYNYSLDAWKIYSYLIAS